MDAQLRKGILEMCVLHLLKDEPQYGYEIMKTIQGVFPGVYDGSIYAVLRRLRSSGCAETFQGKSSEGPPRKYYRLTEDGKRRLHDALKEWAVLVRAVRNLGIAE